MNSRIVSRTTLLLAVFLSAVGCKEDKEFEPVSPFATDEDIQVWATNASAFAVYSHAYEAIGVADGALSFADPACPETSDDGTVLTITGGCTDANDEEWSGQATVTRDGGDHELVMDGYNGNDGTMLVRLVAPAMREFDADMLIGGVTAIEYTGTIGGDYMGPTLWNGSGTVERTGYFRPTGVVDAMTVDQLVDDDTCSGQPVSGTTTLHGRGDTAVITYDGATDCDPDQNARVSVNGKDRGLVAGINCSVANVGATASGVSGHVFAFAAFAALAAFVRRRRPLG